MWDFKVQAQKSIIIKPCTLKHHQFTMASTQPAAKKGPTAYFVFADEHRAAVQAELSAAKERGKVSAAEVAKELGRRWKLLTDTEKEEFKTKAAAVAASNAAAAAEAGEGDAQAEQGDAEATKPSSAPARQGLPISVVKRIISIDEEVGRVSADAVQVVSHACEMFLELMADRCAHVMFASKPKRSTAKLSDIKEILQRDRRLTAAGLGDVVNMAQAAADARAAEAAANKATAAADAETQGDGEEGGAKEHDKENHKAAPKSGGKAAGHKRKAEPVVPMKPITAFFARAEPRNTQA